MAIYRLSSQSIGRGGGKSSVACAAYRAGEKLHDQRLDKTFDYEKKRGVYHSEILLPKNTPEHLKNRQTLWNAVEKSETRSNASLAKEYQLALPHEISHAEKIKLAKDFAETQFVEKGLGVDIAFHDLDKENPHCHLMVTTRLIDEKGLNMDLKPTFFRERSYLVALRKDWELSVNKNLERNGIDQRVCSDSYKKQGFDLNGISVNGYGDSAKGSLNEQQKLNGEKLLENPHIIADVLSTRSATFSLNDMGSFISRHSSPEQSERVLNALILDKSLVDLVNGRFTSASYLQSETQMLESTLKLSRQFSHRVDMGYAVEVAKDLTLNESQQGAFTYALTPDSGIKNLVGMAGSGKSHTLKAIVAVYQQSGYEVKGMALSGIVAENLAKDTAISDSKTLHSFLYQHDRGNIQIDKKTVLVMDEASMVGTKQMSHVLKIAEDHQSKVILVGDNQQLQAIEAGGAYRGVINASSQVCLDEIQRQHKETDRFASLNLATGNVRAALEHYQDDQKIHADPSLKKSLEHVQENYFAQHDKAPDQSQIVLAYRRETVGKLNQAIRAGFEERGLLGDEKTAINGKEFAVGDRFMFLKNEYNFDVRNGTTGVIERIVGDEFQVKTGDGRVINFDSRQYADFDHAYAMTIHKSQGVTVDKTHLLLDNFTDSHLAYVGMTRHKENLDIYHHTREDNQHAVKDFEHLVTLASRNNQKELVSDYKELAATNEANKFIDYTAMSAKFEQFREWILEKIEAVQDYYLAKNELKVTEKEGVILEQKLSVEQEKQLEIREKQAALQAEKEALVAEHAKMVDEKASKQSEREAKGQEKELGGFER